MHIPKSNGWGTICILLWISADSFDSAGSRTPISSFSILSAKMSCLQNVTYCSQSPNPQGETVRKLVF